MEQKKYATVYMEITAEEYKDLIVELTEHRKDAEHERNLRWKAEAALKDAQEELSSLRERINELIHRYEYCCEEVEK